MTSIHELNNDFHISLIDKIVEMKAAKLQHLEIDVVPGFSVIQGVRHAFGNNYEVLEYRLLMMDRSEFMPLPIIMEDGKVGKAESKLHEFLTSRGQKPKVIILAGENPAVQSFFDGYIQNAEEKKLDIIFIKVR